MAEEIYYKRVGRKYVPVSYYDSEVLDAVPIGAHLIVKRASSMSRRYNIEPAIAPLIAAGIYASDAITDAIMEASQLRMPKTSTPITIEQKAAWEHLAELFGAEVYPLEWPSYRDAAEAGIKALQEESVKLLAHPGVQAAYEHFLLMAKLAYEETNSK